MKTATRPDNLEILGHLLQEDLQAKLSESIPVRVRCLLKDDILAVLVQHRGEELPNPQEIFDFLEQTMLTEQSLLKLLLPEEHSVSLPVRMYVRVAGQKQSYCSHSFTVEPPASPTIAATTLENIPEVEQLLKTPLEEGRRRETSQRTGRQGDGETGSNEISDNISTQSEADDQVESEFNPSNVSATFAAPFGGEDQENESDEEAEDSSNSGSIKSKQALIPLAVSGVGLSLAVFFGCLYVLTRPCVMGECTAIAEAKNLRDQSTKTLQNPQSGQEVLGAQQQLIEAINLLETIPPWSKEHPNAEKILQTYRNQHQDLDQMVTALKMAARASYKSQNPPHDAPKWIEIQNLWREAIARLEQLPKTSKLQPLAQAKIKSYKLNLEQIKQRLVQERKALQTLQASKDAALKAEARQGVAQNVNHWQLVYSTWQTALNSLQNIPQGTTAYTEAQKLSDSYQPQVSAARDRKTQEQIAAKTYNQGIYLAKLAQNYQADNQWSAAVTHWRNALTHVKQVPNNTFYYSKAQSLVKPYQGALQQAQGKLRSAVKVQQARRDLNQICSGTSQVCRYSINTSAIKVRLALSYVQKIKQTAMSADSKGDYKTRASLVDHIARLQEALETVSDNAKIRLEIYSPDGVLISSHRPR
ncbi:MAG: hypothetical protein F6J86_09935 [Symploca sp. SIO1B1]|nr:hypothetical protein [Symploca sp. SIO1B1]